MLVILTKIYQQIVCLSRGDLMKIIANNYRANEIFKMIREYTGKTQQEFGKNINRTKTAIQYYEYGQRNFDFELLLEICKKENLNIIIENKK